MLLEWQPQEMLNTHQARDAACMWETLEVIWEEKCFTGFQCLAYMIQRSISIYSWFLKSFLNIRNYLTTEKNIDLSDEKNYQRSQWCKKNSFKNPTSINVLVLIRTRLIFGMGRTQRLFYATSCHCQGQGSLGVRRCQGSCVMVSNCMWIVCLFLVHHC